MTAAMLALLMFILPRLGTAPVLFAAIGFLALLEVTALLFNLLPCPGSLVTAIHAAGLNAPEIAKRAPFDLVISNILLRPLQRLAAPMARQLEPNARIVLSGILKSQANAALTAYRSQGLMLERSFPLDGWFTPVMVALSG